MNDNPFICLDDRRRRARRASGLNGIDSVRVVDALTLQVTMLQRWADPAKPGLDKSHVRLEGGRRRTPPKIKDVVGFKDEDERGGVFEVILEDRLEPATYTLRLVNVESRFDPLFTHGRFLVHPPGASEEDCVPADWPPRPAAPTPVIDYLAKDYASFRRLLLDRLAQTLPEWKERRAADLGITLVELMAYVGDHLSYYQDAVATEAYLHTARRRVSVRRHVRLVDYHMHDGCNARAWIQVEVEQDVRVSELRFFTEPEDFRSRSARPPIRFATDLVKQSERDRIVFEPMMTNREWLVPEQNLMPFYTWGDGECCLPQGATSATVALLPGVDLRVGPDGNLFGWPAGGGDLGKLRRPRPGDLVLFEEVRGPITGLPADADRTFRHVVRLTSVKEVEDEEPPPPVGPIRPGDNARLFDIAWDRRDALPFALCLSKEAQNHVSVARGNVVLADHGLTVNDPVRPGQRQPEAAQVESSPCAWRPSHGAVVSLAPKEEAWPRTLRYDPLPQAPLTHAAPFPDSAKQARVQARRLARWRDEDLVSWLRQTYHRVPADRKNVDFVAVLGKLNALLDGIVASLRGGLVVSQSKFVELQKHLNHIVQGVNAPLDFIGPACDDLRQEPRAAVPIVKLAEVSDVWADPRPEEYLWRAQRDLLSSGPDDRHFVVEIDDENAARLRFGDGRTGRIPPLRTDFRAEYRVGNGTAGNVGAETIRGWLGGGLAVRSVRNPLQAAGGTDPEAAAAARLLAPTAFARDLRRAVTADDYARLAERDERVQRAAAELLWAGTGHVVRIALDLRASALDVPDPHAEARLICSEVQADLRHYRRMGHEISVVPARAVPIAIHLTLTLKERVQEARVRAELKAILGTSDLPDGRRGLFHPDNLTFGQAVYGSVIVTAAQQVSGVESVNLVQLRRLNWPHPLLPTDETLLMGPLELVELGELNLDPEGEP